MSAPFRPAAFTRTSTSPLAGSGSGWSATTSSPPSRMVTAFMSGHLVLGQVDVDGLRVLALGRHEQARAGERVARRLEALALALEMAGAHEPVERRVDLGTLRAEHRGELVGHQGAVGVQVGEHPLGELIHAGHARSKTATHSMCGVCGNMSTGRTRLSS